MNLIQLNDTNVLFFVLDTYLNKQKTKPRGGHLGAYRCFQNLCLSSIYI